MDMAERQLCAACGVDRQVIRRKPVTKGYEIQSLECPKCRTVMRMVRKRYVPEAHHLGKRKLARDR